GLVPGVCVPERIHRSSDGTRKIAVRLRDGALIETVLLPAVSGPGSAAELDADAASADDEDDDEPEISRPAAAAPRTRVTQCISTQVGCAMGCVFCASGVAGLKRHMGADEIVAQVLMGRSRLDAREQLR